jgi:hypothetical protein
MTETSEKIRNLKELRENTGASLSDCTKALEESNGDITKAYEWLLTNTNTFSAGGDISFQAAMQEIKERLSTLWEGNAQATQSLKEAEITLNDLKKNFDELEPELEKIGKDAFDSGEWAASQNFTVKSLFEKISTTKVKLSDAEAAKTNRQEESKKGFWSRVKVAVGDILDPIESLKKQLGAEYVELAKLIITSSDNTERLNQLASEALVVRVREISNMKSSAEERRSSALSTLTHTMHDIGILTSTAKKNLRACTSLAEFEECMQEFDVEVGEELRKQAAKIIPTASLDSSVPPLPEGVLMVAKGVSGQLELLEDRIRLKREGVLSFMTHGFKGDKEILIERISAIQFKNAGPVLSGYIQFSFLGSQEAKGGLFDATKDENTVVFTWKEQEKFQNIKQEIEKRMSPHKTKPQQSSPSSNLDELERLASFRDKGILTEEEFQTKKRQILGL